MQRVPALFWSVAQHRYLMICVAMNSCVSDKCRIVPFTERLLRVPSVLLLPLAAQPAPLPEDKPVPESSVVVGEGWRGLSAACSRRACAAPVQHLQGLLSLRESGSPRCRGPGSRLQHVWICRCSASFSVSRASAVKGWPSCQGVFIPHN